MLTFFRIRASTREGKGRTFDQLDDKVIKQPYIIFLWSSTETPCRCIIRAYRVLQLNSISHKGVLPFWSLIPLRRVPFPASVLCGFRSDHKQCLYNIILRWCTNFSRNNHTRMTSPSKSFL